MASTLPLRTLTKQYRDTAANHTLNQAGQDFIGHVILTFYDTLLTFSSIRVLPTVLVFFSCKNGSEVLYWFEIRKTTRKRQQIHSFPFIQSLMSIEVCIRQLFCYNNPTFLTFKCWNWHEMLRKRFTMHNTPLMLRKHLLVYMNMLPVVRKSIKTV